MNDKKVGFSFAKDCKETPKQLYDKLQALDKMNLEEAMDDKQIRFSDWENKLHPTRTIMVKDAISIAKQYAKEMCKEQRENCSEYAEIGHDREGGLFIDKATILAAPLPKELQ